MNHVLKAQQFTPELMSLIFNRAAELEVAMHDKRRHQKVGDLLSSGMLFTIFYEPSTRTRMSFAAAGQHLGMQVVGTENAREFSSAIKGETLEDSIRVLCQYQPSAIVLRHHENHAAERAAKVSTVPIINAGDGAGQHPTQALLDMYTIRKELGRTQDLNVIIGGDLLHGRTARSLSYLLAKYSGNTITYVSPKELKIGNDIKTHLKKHGVKFIETEDLESALPDADVVYWTRIQKERFEGEAVIANSYHISKKHLKLMKKKSVIMHPLPRVDEISTEVDDDPRAVYIEQAGNGMYVRMALIEWVLGYL
jgi:aspartate carbamoyltransferase catalytic subunit